MRAMWKLIAICLMLAACGSVTSTPGDSDAGGTAGAVGAAGAAGAPATTGAGGIILTGAGGAAGAGGAGGAGTGGAGGGCSADTSKDPNNCGTCGLICPPATESKPNDSQQTCFQGKCYIPSGDVCTADAECITGYCQHTGGSAFCNPKSCSVGGAACPAATPNCDDPSNGYARCTSASTGCVCSVN